MTETQLRLIDPREVSWRLDEHTKAVGRQGLARARAALAAAPNPAQERSYEHAAVHSHAA